VYADDPCETCNAEGGVTLQDADGDGICDESDNCVDTTACNYNDENNVACESLECGCLPLDNHDWIVMSQFSDGAAQEEDGTGGNIQPAWLALDGDPNTFSHSVCGSPNNPFWQVDFGVELEIEKVALTLRMDCCWDRINGARIELDDQIIVAALSESQFANYHLEIELPATVTGTTLRIIKPGNSYACNVIHLAEVAVFGGLPGCDCSGSDLDALGICNGSCMTDSDADGICDDQDNCIDMTACNYGDAGNAPCSFPPIWYSDSDGDGTGATYDFVYACDQPEGYVSDAGDICPDDTNKLAPGLCGCGQVDTDLDQDGLCDDQDGCTDINACNYDQPLATECLTLNDCGICGPPTITTCGLQGACNYDPSGDCFDEDLCDFESCAGCMNPTACNFDDTATISSPVDCSFPAFAWVDCAGNCLNDADQNGICDEIEVTGCTQEAAINFNPAATVDDGSCFTEIVGCIIPSALNYDVNATVQGAPLGDYCVFPPSIGSLPGPGVAYLPGPGCTDSNACNYDFEATSDDGSCEFGSCQGCDEPSACNYDSTALYNDGSCEWTSCVGCTNPLACDYDASATISDTCDFVSCQGCTLSAATNYDPSATQDDGSCIIEGCTNVNACNFDATATSNDGSCSFAAAFYNCDGDCNNDSDEDGVCDELEIQGCTNASACNYEVSATEDDGSCVLPQTWYEDADGDGFGDNASTTSACTQPAGYVSNATDNCPANTNKQEPGDCGCDNADDDNDADGVADCNDICMDTSACNYDANPTEACTYATLWYADADGDGFGDASVSSTACEAPSGYVANATDNCPSDVNKQNPGDCGCGVADDDNDGDGVSDCMDSCTDTSACNFDADPTEACDYGTPGYDCDGNCLDLNDNSVCDITEGATTGCLDETACNYDVSATLPDPASCTFLYFNGIDVEATSQAGAADGMLVPDFTGGTGTVDLWEVDEEVAYPSAVWGAMVEGRYMFRMKDADGCLSVETLEVLLPHRQCD
ncbi:MAG: hypothetical protein ACPGYK_09355, partial [Flavobacteriales bacterium]